LIPEYTTIYSDELQIETMPSNTYKINFQTRRTGKMIDSLEAVDQAINIILDTNRYEELIYPDWFGNELYTLVGKERFYVESEAARMIKEALMVDDRIIAINNFVILDGEERDELIIRFTVITIFGEIEKEKNIGW
jgi:hypothetical protein